MRILLLSIVVFFSACNPKPQTSTNKTSPKTTSPKTAVPHAPLLPIPDKDPFFTPKDNISSRYGPSNITRNILQDSKGDYWFATWEGILHCDQKSMASGKPLFTNLTNKNDLRRFRAFTLLEDRLGNIWIGTIGAGVYKYNGKSFKNFTNLDGLISNRVGCLMQDRTGNIWMGTEGGISVWDGKKFKNYTVKDGLLDNDINSIVEDEKGVFWIGARGEACTFDGEKFERILRPGNQPFVNVRCIIEDQKGSIWLGGNDGLWNYDGNTYLKHTDSFTGYIYEDRKGDIWTSEAASENGNTNEWLVFKRYVNSFENMKMVTEEIKREKGMFFGIIEDTQGDIWLGTVAGVYRYDGKSFENFRE